MPRRLDMGKDKFGLKGVTTEHYPDPRILQANNTFHCQPPMPLMRALADLAGRMRIGQMISWAHRFMISSNSTFPLPQLPSTALWSEGWTAVLSPSDAQSLHWFLSINTGKQMWSFQDKIWVNRMCLKTSHRDFSLRPHLMSKILSSPHHILYFSFKKTHHMWVYFGNHYWESPVFAHLLLVLPILLHSFPRSEQPHLPWIPQGRPPW